MVALVRGIPRNFDDITMKTSHVDKVDTGSGCILWSSWAPLGGITEEELEGVCAVDKVGAYEGTCTNCALKTYGSQDC